MREQDVRRIVREELAAIRSQTPWAALRRIAISAKRRCAGRREFDVTTLDSRASSIPELGIDSSARRSALRCNEGWGDLR